MWFERCTSIRQDGLPLAVIPAIPLVQMKPKNQLQAFHGRGRLLTRMEGECSVLGAETQAKFG